MDQLVQFLARVILVDQIELILHFFFCTHYTHVLSINIHVGIARRRIQWLFVLAFVMLTVGVVHPSKPADPYNFTTHVFGGSNLR